MATRVVMPPLGDSSDEAKVLKWYRAEGDLVERGSVLLDIETDKTTIELEAYATGTLRRVLVPAGETVSVGTTLAVIADPDEDISALVAGS
jgi:pyruvate dehydrogenase E2 component (dihydrolipoamide acetyltransferase)